MSPIDIQDVRPRSDVAFSPFSSLNREDDLRRYAFVYTVIQDVPWDEVGVGSFMGDPEKLKEAVDSVLVGRGETREHFSYRDEKWVDGDVVINFSGFSGELFDLVRIFVLYERVRIDWRAALTVSGYVRTLQKVFTGLGMGTDSFRLEYIHEGDIIRFFKESDYALSVKNTMTYPVKEFFEFLKVNFPEGKYRMDMNRLSTFFEGYIADYRRYLSFRHHPSIPDRVFFEIHFRMVEIMRDSCSEHNARVWACVVLIYLWSGLRPRDVRSLLLGYVVTREEQGETLYFYEYICGKPKRHALIFVLFPIVLEAVRTLEELHGCDPSEKLIVFRDARHGGPVSEKSFDDRYRKFMRKEMEPFCRKAAADLGCKVEDIRSSYFPTFYAYRVHLYTFLVDHGFDNRWVEAHLGHISESVMGTYYRMSDSKAAEMRGKVEEHFSLAYDKLRDVSREMEEQTPEPPKTPAELLLDI